MGQGRLVCEEEEKRELAHVLVCVVSSNSIIVARTMSSYERSGGSVSSPRASVCFAGYAFRAIPVESVSITYVRSSRWFHYSLGVLYLQPFPHPDSPRI